VHLLCAAKSFNISLELPNHGKHAQSSRQHQTVNAYTFSGKRCDCAKKHIELSAYGGWVARTVVAQQVAMFCSDVSWLGVQDAQGAQPVTCMGH
jgi:hypothetical protein